jgi:hypothetical protein
MESVILKLVQMDIFMSYLMLVKFSEFPVMDEENSDTIFIYLFMNTRLNMTWMNIGGGLYPRVVGN